MMKGLVLKASGIAHQCRAIAARLLRCFAWQFAGRKQSSKDQLGRNGYIGGMERETILVVDDDREIRSLLSKYLENAGYTILAAANAAEMFATLKNETPALIILDVMMPGKDGVAACRELRQQSNVPVMMLTALGEPIERTIGLEVGADDYVGKPFLPRELLARVRAILRRTGNNDMNHAATSTKRQIKSFAHLTVDLDRCEVSTDNGEPVVLTSAEYRLLLVFLERAQRVLSRELLLQLTHGDAAESFDRSIDVLVSRLRSKLGDQATGSKLIRTVRGGGYMFVEPVHSVDVVPATAAAGGR
jgi:two-component system, OmpR family, response regulator